MSWISELNAIFEKSAGTELDDKTIARLTKNYRVSQAHIGKKNSKEAFAALNLTKKGEPMRKEWLETRRKQTIERLKANLEVPQTLSNRPRMFTADQIRDMRRRHLSGELGKDLALRFNTTRATVSGILTGKLYSDVPLEDSPN